MNLKSLLMPTRPVTKISKANIRLENSPTESTAEKEATESAKIVEAAELAKVSKKTMQDAVQSLAV